MPETIGRLVSTERMVEVMAAVQVQADFRIGDVRHTVDLVAQIPGKHGRMIFELAHEAAHQADLPLHGYWVGQDVQSFEGRRHVQAPTHPAGDQADD